MSDSPVLTSVAIVDDHALFAEALDVTLTLEGHRVQRLPVSDHATSGQMLNALLRAQPDIALLDLDLGPAGDGVRLVQPLTHSGISVVVITAGLDRARWGECLHDGARAVTSKSAPLQEILRTIRLVAEGRHVHSAEERQNLITQFHAQRETSRALRRRLDLLTTREGEVLAHLMDGRPVREIARVSFVSEATVRTQVKSILAKLDVSSQLAAVGAAHKVGWRPRVLPPRRDH